jgi:hypothetical protein
MRTFRISHRLIQSFTALTLYLASTGISFGQDTFSIVQREADLGPHAPAGASNGTLYTYVRIASPYAAVLDGVSISGNKITVITTIALDTLIPGSTEVLIGAFPSTQTYEVEVLTGPTAARATQSLGVARFVGLGVRSTIFAPPNYTDLWWNPGESGWGMNITMKQNVFFAVWYVYDQAGAATWYTLQQGKWVNSSCYSGDIIKTNGPVLGGIAPPPLLNLNVAIAGDATICFSEYSKAEMSYRLLGVGSGIKSIVRQSF